MNHVNGVTTTQRTITMSVVEIESEIDDIQNIHTKW